MRRIAPVGLHSATSLRRGTRRCGRVPRPRSCVPGLRDRLIAHLCDASLATPPPHSSLTWESMRLRVLTRPSAQMRRIAPVGLHSATSLRRGTRRCGRVPRPRSCVPGLRDRLIAHLCDASLATPPPHSSLTWESMRLRVLTRPSAQMRRIAPPCLRIDGT